MRSNLDGSFDDDDEVDPAIYEREETDNQKIVDKLLIKNTINKTESAYACKNCKTPCFRANKRFKLEEPDYWFNGTNVGDFHHTNIYQEGLMNVS